MSSHEHLTQLGATSASPESPEEAVLEVVPAPDGPFLVRFTCPEFTTLCPVTGQPDFAHLVIDYVPDRLLVESKSLKLFLHSFRNTRDFHEACTLTVPGASRRSPAVSGSASAGTGTRAAAFPSTSSTNRARCPTVCGSPTKAWRHIADEGDYVTEFDQGPPRPALLR